MQVLPVEEKIADGENVLPYERVSSLIEDGQSFLVNDCICKKRQDFLGQPCDRPVQVCLAVAPIPGVFDNSPQGRVLSRSEAYDLLKKTEEQRTRPLDQQRAVWIVLHLQLLQMLLRSPGGDQ